MLEVVRVSKLVDDIGEVRTERAIKVLYNADRIDKEHAEYLLDVLAGIVLWREAGFAVSNDLTGKLERIYDLNDMTLLRLEEVA